MVVYYQAQPGPKNYKVNAFPEGFRMIAGDALKRNTSNTWAEQAIYFSCLDFDKVNIDLEDPKRYPEIPNMNCPDGLRATVYFPSCWDGKNLDPADHRSHVVYPIDGYDIGTCPDTHPVKLMGSFFETTWRVDQFHDMWYGANHPFVFAQGDPTGYGYHGDFVNGWDVPTLQSAVDYCTNQSGNLTDCPTLQTYTVDESEACTLSASFDENIKGPALVALPGCNPVTHGPAPAVPVTDCPADNVKVIGSLTGPVVDPAVMVQTSVADRLARVPEIDEYGCAATPQGCPGPAGGATSNNNAQIRAPGTVVTSGSSDGSGSTGGQVSAAEAPSDSTAGDAAAVAAPSSSSSAAPSSTSAGVAAGRRNKFRGSSRGRSFGMF